MTKRLLPPQKARGEYYAAYFGGCLITCGATLVLFWGHQVGGQSRVDRYLLSAGIAVVGIALVFISVMRYATARARFQEAEEAQSRMAVGTAIEQLKHDVNFPSLLKLNQTQMDQYHDITKHQAENAYRNSQIAMGSGLAILVGAAVAAILLPSNTSKIILGGVAGIGAAFSAYIGATFLNAYHAALAQLNFYFRQPLVNSYLLSAERLASDMPDDRRDKMREKIIDAMLQEGIADIRYGPDGSVPRVWPSRTRRAPTAGSGETE
jgi:hypothetical protein